MADLKTFGGQKFMKPSTATFFIIALSECLGPRLLQAGDDNVVSLAPFELEESEIDPNHSDYLRTHLERFGLLPLAEVTGEAFLERYRFLWCRSFHPAILIEVEFKTDGSGEYRAMSWNAERGSGRWAPVKTRALEKSTLDYYRRMIASYDLFNLPWYDGRGGYDGSSWFLELIRGDEHHELYRWSPEDGPVRTFGISLIEMGIDSVLVPIY